MKQKKHIRQMFGRANTKNGTPLPTWAWVALAVLLQILLLATCAVPSDRAPQAPLEELSSVCLDEISLPEESSISDPSSEEESEQPVSQATASKPAPEKPSTQEESSKKPAEPGGIPTADGIPHYAGQPYAILNGNQPLFRPDDLRHVGFEQYSPLDRLGRCGAALASLGLETMPAPDEERGSISSIRPSGWVQAKYDHIPGKYLYNRCHLIGWQLSAENANPRNLITGTKYLNIEGMLPFENMVADYIKETGNHVAYRITPLYAGNNLLASGVRMEAYSVEDEGEGICFHVFCYNVQPGVTIHYASGQSGEGAFEEASHPAEEIVPPAPSEEGDRMVYVTPTGKKYHFDPKCGGKNSRPIPLKEAEEQGYTPCKRCANG